jgi:hypothetical protein
MNLSMPDISTLADPMQAYAAQPNVARASVTDARMKFDRVMSNLEPSREDKATDAAKQLVATAFLKPMFEMIEKDPLKSDLLHGGFGESAFRDHLHTVLRERMVHGQSNVPLGQGSNSSGAFDDLVSEIRDRILRAGGRQAYGRAGEGLATGTAREQWTR